ncbi:hypothetical protein D3C81_2199830 [compost metagenome]
MEELANHRGVHGLFKIGISQHHERCVASQLKCDMLQVLAATSDPANVTTDIGGAGE